MPSFASTKEFWSTIVLAAAAIGVVWRGLKAVAKEIRELVVKLAYIQTCLKDYGPTLITIARAYHADSGQSLVNAVIRVEGLSQEIAKIAKDAKRGSDAAIETLQQAIGNLEMKFQTIIERLDRQDLASSIASGSTPPSQPPAR